VQDEIIGLFPEHPGRARSVVELIAGSVLLVLWLDPTLPSSLPVPEDSLDLLTGLVWVTLSLTLVAQGARRIFLSDHSPRISTVTRLADYILFFVMSVWIVGGVEACAFS